MAKFVSSVVAGRSKLHGLEVCGHHPEVFSLQFEEWSRLPRSPLGYLQRRGRGEIKAQLH